MEIRSISDTRGSLNKGSMTPLGSLMELFIFHAL